ncbi:hypothetical protein [Streptomyces sp. TLI_171]|uniref:hypothetical protein n=1 Tax=Streptomyces sp. TLI_171 TaxID=1938859 RepID=UPI000C180AD1|nr:hypothetical protein [Streptomyces sp. TLI_171]RKE23218.1 hypothetical protein BX266_6676 [Streptomyces sp. TLI_171]
MRDAERNGSDRRPVRQGPVERPSQPGPKGGRGARVALAAGAAAAGLAALAACGGTSGENPVQAAMSTFTVGPPEVTNFSGEPASPFASAHESALASVSAASASAEARASAFEASANAQLAAGREKAKQVLENVPDAGNAITDVTLTGVPNSVSGDLTAAVVTITNSTAETRNYAVQVDFTDNAGKTVDSTVVGVENLAPGATANPVAFSRQGKDVNVIPIVVKAYRY